MNNETYNGWANRETWAAWVGITNSQFWLELCTGWDAADMAATLSSTLANPNPHDRAQLDLVENIGDVSRVNWAEIAAALAENVGHGEKT